MAKIDVTTRNLMLDSLRHYAKDNISFNFIREHDAKNEIPLPLLKEMYDPKILGVHLLLIPIEYGGLAGSTTDIYRVCEELARIDLGIATSVFATFLGSDPLNVGGTEAQKAKWFGKIAKEQLLVAYGATEADAGSDLVSLRTRAEHVLNPDGTLKGYKITGSKMWISNGGVADIYTVLAIAPGGPSWFIVEKNTPGFTSDAHEDKHGIRLSNTAGLSFDDVYVPVENLIGLKEGQGLLQAQAVFGYTRLMVAAFGLGAGEEATETAIHYAQQRIQAGGPLVDKQGYMLKLITPHYIRFEAARAFIDNTAKMLDDNNHGFATEGAIAKYYATEEGNNAAEHAIQALGGFGYTKEFSVEKIKRDVKITMIYEGTNEVMEMTIYRGRWQEHLKSRGQYYIDMAAQLEAAHAKNPNVGADSMALGLKALAKVLEECRLQKLTRHQFITFKLGELIANAEVAAVFVKRCAEGIVTEGSRFDIGTLQAMSRVLGRECAFDIATRGLKYVIGAGTGNAAQLSQDVNLVEIEDKMRGTIEDSDIVSAKLKEIFKK
ncbi:Acyl-CoA dehydrogenase domain protein [Elusimicrobium minutum Pei191]|uniref:Acyl-CoA dehydrogenase domain protein n=1 Tax=Elusimicrobium minutum (strain Pei191) TaxID=445932 RepID=B2KET8_ELUMP|nr:acyl-CoA dehydrogenase family protein [Elusimicrobium minutum]ACC99034.1 Acyl-CoA dehydrogenase domain protein [Elusimicrobium minutum Pei191]